MLLGLVIGQCLIYTRFVKTDKKHIVAFVVSRPILASAVIPMLIHPGRVCHVYACKHNRVRLAVLSCLLQLTPSILLWLTEIFVWHFSEYLIFSDGSCKLIQLVWCARSS